MLRPTPYAWSFFTAFLWSLFLSPLGNGQEAERIDRTQLLDAIAAVQAEDATSLKAARAVFQQQIDVPIPSLERSVSALALAIAALEVDAIHTGLDQVRASNSDSIEDLLPTLDALDLCVSLHRADVMRIQTLYKAGVRLAIDSKKSLALRREKIMMLGFLHGLWRNGEHCPIDKEVVERGISLLEQIKEKSLVSMHREAQERGVSLCEQIQDRWENWSPMPASSRSNDLTQWADSLEELRKDHAALRSETRMALGDQRASQRGKIQSFRRMQGELAQVVLQENQPTVGHPGDPPVAPTVPSRDRVQVDEYETKREKKGDKWVTVREKRDNREIERERDEKLAAWKIRYQRDRKRYDELMAVYTQALQKWVQLDLARRKELRERHQELEAHIGEALAEKEREDEEHDQAVKALRQIDSEIDALVLQIRLGRWIDESLEKEDPELPYRAAIWQGVDSIAWRNELLDWLRKKR